MNAHPQPPKASCRWLICSLSKTSNVIDHLLITSTTDVKSVKADNSIPSYKSTRDKLLRRGMNSVWFFIMLNIFKNWQQKTQKFIKTTIAQNHDIFSSCLRATLNQTEKNPYQ